MSWQRLKVWAALACLAAAGGCRGTYGNTETGALVGTGFGTLAGAVIGSATGHAGAGALIGAATGAAAGGLIGNATDAQMERDDAIAQANYASIRARVAEESLTSGDVIAMDQNGVSDDVIVNSLRQHGCRFSSAPESIIQLKNAGVSDRVIRSMQANAGAPYPAVVYAPRYAPPPRPYVVYGYGYGWGPRYRRHCW